MSVTIGAMNTFLRKNNAGFTAGHFNNSGMVTFTATNAPIETPEPIKVRTLWHISPDELPEMFALYI